MAFKTGQLGFAYDSVRQMALQVKEYCTRRHTDMTNGSVPSTMIFDVLISARSWNNIFDLYKNTPGLATYAQGQNDDPTYNIGAEFTAMQAAITALGDEIVSTFPKDGNGFLLASTFGANGPVDRAFSPVETAALRTRLQDVIGTIS